MSNLEHDPRIPCYACGKPVHIDELGGLMKIGDETALFHNNIVCLIQMSKHIKVA